MAWASLVDLKHDDEDRYDLEKGMPDDYEAPDYPTNCQFSVTAEDLEKAGCDGGEPGDSCHFAVMGEVTSIFKGMEDCRVEIQIGEMADEEGHFFDLSEPSYLCLCQRELEKLDLDADCERGDLIHLVGTARMESSSSTEYADRVTLQITDLGYVGNESQESREG